MNKHSLFKVGFVVTILISGFVFSACGSSSSSTPPKELTAEEKKAKEGREALEAKKAEYTTIPAKEQLSKEPYRKKKLLFYRIDPDDKDGKDPWISYFPSDVSRDAQSKLEFKLAKSPDEVGTIALLQKCKEVEAGQYGSLARAYKEQCELVLIDHELGAVVYREIFEGKPDDIKTIRNGETSVTAKMDMTKVVDFLDRLRDKEDVSSAKTNKK